MHLSGREWLINAQFRRAAALTNTDPAMTSRSIHGPTDLIVKACDSSPDQPRTLRPIRASNRGASRGKSLRAMAHCWRTNCSAAFIIFKETGVNSPKNNARRGRRVRQASLKLIGNWEEERCQSIGKHREEECAFPNQMRVIIPRSIAHN
jgi:hypothetical protein